jgi:tetratricopeptide (TPR) repeat protein
MTFEEMLDQALAMLQRRGRVTYGMLNRQFQLDEEALADLKAALLYTYPEVRNDAGRGLVCTGKAVATPSVPSPTASPQAREPRSYTPSHLAEKILHSRAALEGERKQVTILFADTKSSMQFGEAYLLADQVEDARACADRAMRLTRERGERGYEAWAISLLSDIASHQDRPDVATAEKHYGAAMALASDLGIRPLVTHCHRGLGAL